MDREGGFTLLETIIALAIAATALSLLAMTLSGAMDSTARLARRADALARARSHLDAVMAMPRLPSGPNEGDDGDGYTWRIDARRIGTAPPGHGQSQAFFAIAVEIDWGFGGSVRLTGRRFAPTPPQ